MKRTGRGGGIVLVFGLIKFLNDRVKLLSVGSFSSILLSLLGGRIVCRLTAALLRKEINELVKGL